MAARGKESNEISIWNLKNPKRPLTTLKKFQDWTHPDSAHITALLALSDNRIASTSTWWPDRDFKITIWDLDTQQPVKVIKTFHDVSALVLLPNYSIVPVSGKTIEIWSFDEKQLKLLDEACKEAMHLPAKATPQKEVKREAAAV